jgi:hypothetical protein
MKHLIYLINSLVFSIVTTGIILTVSFLIMLFSSKDIGYKTTYFGSLFFNSIEKGNDTLGLHIGIANWGPIVLTIIILMLFYYIITIFLKKHTHSK